jgi:alkanesulfonate monooxygenase SsuD/methylene tetrahydromethanopterin reductase-like flavin-dependent oxidoreductase (luciferase family)
LIGLVAPSDRGAVAHLEALGATSFWVGGHLASTNPSPEALMWLARLVEQTDHAVVGTAALLLPLYPPAIIAKQLADLDRSADGRLAVGIGVGGEYPSDFAAAEVPISERGPRTDEALDLLRRFWTGSPVTHHGTHHAFDDLRIHPAPAQADGPPLLITGRRPVAMRRAARTGDGWMPYLYSPERYQRSVATILDHAKEFDRPLDDFIWSSYVFVALDDDPSIARTRALEFFGTTYHDDYADFIDRVACIGDADAVTNRLQAFCDAGARQFVLAPIGADTVGISERLLAEIAPRLEIR